MAPSDTRSLLEKVSEILNIDVDSLDTGFIRSLPIRPVDQTCNPLWLNNQLQDPSSADLLASTISESPDSGFIDVYSTMAVKLCLRNIDLIQGRVLVQTLPSAAYNESQTLVHARAYIAQFAKAGISKDRYCIKIMATGPGLQVAKILSDEGVCILGTGVFSVEQAIACSQAGCFYISPYYNETRSHKEPSLWPNVKDPALEHPFSNRIAQMVDAFTTLYQRTGKRQPLIKNAAYRSYREVIATAELGCHSATISPKVLAEMAGMSADETATPTITKVASLENPYASETTVLGSRLTGLLSADPLWPTSAGAWQPCDLDTDYIGHGGKGLQEAMRNNPAATSRLADALEMFAVAETESRRVIQGMSAKEARI